MRRRTTLRAALVALPLVAFACATQPNFSYYNDIDGGEAGAPRPDGHVLLEASTTDSTVGDDGAALMDDASEDAPASDDGGSGDGETMEAAVEAGCGPVDTPSNCGACGVACDISCSVNGGAGLCSYVSCASGFADCDAAAPNANGCETPTTTLYNCGACGVACNTANSVDASCGITGCSYTCAPGFADCDAAPPNVNGCSTSTMTVTNCGACGVACDTAHSVDASCGPTGCTYACAPNFANCDTTSALGNTGGCACSTPACCSTTGATPGAGGPGYACETTHSNGVGQSFYDCTATGTYSEPQALAACEAYVASIGLPASDCLAPSECTYVIGGVTHSTPYDAVFYLNSTATAGYVWVYTTLNGATGGLVYPAATFCSTRAGGVSWN
jgi:hypothetical protein